MDYKELFTKLYSDKCFHNFCNMVDQLKREENKIELPCDTALLLITANVDYIKGNENIDAIHMLVKNYLNPNGRSISKNTPFYDYFVIANIILIAMDNKKYFEDDKFIQLPLDFTVSANSICKFDTCSCGYKPKIIFSSFINSLTGKAMCKKCGLSVKKMFVHETSFFDKSDNGEIYENLEEGIKKLADSWNKEVAKGESILHRTMMELLSYDAEVCVDPILYDLHQKLYSYMVDNNIYKKPNYWNERGYWETATDKMMECGEAVKLVEYYLWENMPNRIAD